MDDNHWIVPINQEVNPAGLSQFIRQFPRSKRGCSCVECYNGLDFIYDVRRYSVLIRESRACRNASHYYFDDQLATYRDALQVAAGDLSYWNALAGLGCWFHRMVDGVAHSHASINPGCTHCAHSQRVRSREREAALSKAQYLMRGIAELMSWHVQHVRTRKDASIVYIKRNPLYCYSIGNTDLYAV